MFLANTCQVIKVHFFRVIINLEPPPIPLHEKTYIKLVSYKFFPPSRRARPPPLSFHCVQPRKFLFLTSTLKKYLVAVKLLSCKNWIGGCGGGRGVQKPFSRADPNIIIIGHVHATPGPLYCCCRGARPHCQSTLLGPANVIRLLR